MVDGPEARVGPPRDVAAGGPFTWAQVKAAGWTRSAVDRELATGRWLRLHQGVYVDSVRLVAMDERAQHLVRVQGRLLCLRPGWHAARRSAAVTHRLPLLGPLPNAPQLVAAKVRDSDRSSSRHERLAPLPERDTCVVDGLRATSVARTVVDIARLETFEGGLVVADAALRAGLDRELLEEVAHRCAGWPGGPQALRVVEFADGLSESPLESISRARVVTCGLPVPELQVEVWVGDRLLGRVDKLWRDCNLVGEDDGRSKYGNADDFYDEKIRQEALEAVGLQVVRWNWNLAFSLQGELEMRIRRGMRRGALNELDPRVRFVPTTVADAARRARRDRRVS
jgi:hypothetical protein